jgi:ferredoxin-NADP reductase
MQLGYVEITVRRQPQGQASVFLNDGAQPGLTLEARGPFGQFCLDENSQNKIVLFAGGSGITRIMSMLRYIDDLCLNIEVTFFRNARTQRDISLKPTCGC